MLNRSKLWAAALLFAVFAAGIAVGGAASAAWGDPRGSEATDGRRGRYAERLQQELALSQEQRDSVDAILARRKAAMRALWSEIEPRFDSLRTAIRAEIATLLDAEQTEAYRALIARSDSAHAHRHHRGRNGR